MNKLEELENEKWIIYCRWRADIHRNAIKFHSTALVLLLLLTFLLILSACSIDESEFSYKSYDGAICKRRIRYECGMNLWDCDNGKEYYCVQNVEGVRKK